MKIQLYCEVCEGIYSITFGPKDLIDFFLERLRLRNRLLNDDIFDIFLDYPLVYK